MIYNKSMQNVWAVSKPLTKGIMQPKAMDNTASWTWNSGTIDIKMLFNQIFLPRNHMYYISNWSPFNSEQIDVWQARAKYVGSYQNLWNLF